MIDWNTHQLNPRNKVQDDPLKKEVIAPLRAYFQINWIAVGRIYVLIVGTTFAYIHAFVTGVLTASSFHQLSASTHFSPSKLQTHLQVEVSDRTLFLHCQWTDLMF